MFVLLKGEFSFLSLRRLKSHRRYLLLPCLPPLLVLVAVAFVHLSCGLTLQKGGTASKESVKWEKRERKSTNFFFKLGRKEATQVHSISFE